MHERDHSLGVLLVHPRLQIAPVQRRATTTVGWRTGDVRLGIVHVVAALLLLLLPVLMWYMVFIVGIILAGHVG